MTRKSKKDIEKRKRKKRLERWLDSRGMAEITGTTRVHPNIKILEAVTTRDPALVSKTNFVSFVNGKDMLIGIVHIDNYLRPIFFDRTYCI